MATAFTKWTVLPHKPLEKHSDVLWSVEGTMPDGNTRRVMTLAKRADGKIVVHNAIALEEPFMQELEAWGTPSYLVVPNAYHRMDARIWKDRYPSITVVCPEGAQNAVGKVVAPERVYGPSVSDEQVQLEHLDGVKAQEGVMLVHSKTGTTVVFNDAVMNMPKVGFPMGVILAPTGRPAVPRVVRWLVMKDRKALVKNLERLAETPKLERMIVSHGKAITDDPAGTLHGVARELAG